MIPAEEKFLQTKKSLTAHIISFLGGRVAEEIVFDTVTTGAYNDFQNATKIARSMVTEYGMSDLGPIQYESSGGNVFLGRDYFKEKNFSDQVAHEIDTEVRHIITQCFDTAKTIIEENRKLLEIKIENIQKRKGDLSKEERQERKKENWGSDSRFV